MHMDQTTAPDRYERTRKQPKRRPASPLYLLSALALLLFLAGFLLGRFSVGLTGIVQAGYWEDEDTESGLSLSDGYNPMKEDWTLLLVNRWNPLPDDYAPSLSPIRDHQFDARAVDALDAMLSAAKAEGLFPVICSSYRSVERQQELYEDIVSDYVSQGYTRQEAETLTGHVIAYPGTSEHHTGLAVDIVALSYQLLEEDQEETAESVWLHANCHRFGFILRYPKEKEAVTGIVYEPWHYRYVGIEHATAIMEGGLSLEEYLGLDA